MTVHHASRPDLSRLNDRELTKSLGNILTRERGALVEGLWHLAEIEDRRIHLAEGHSSIFVYCTRKYRLSEGCAYRRSRAVVLFRRFPLIAEYLADGRISLTKLILIQELLTEDNLVELLDKASA